MQINRKEYPFALQHENVGSRRSNYCKAPLSQTHTVSRAARKHAHAHRHTHSFPVEFVSSMTCFPTQQHLPQASNKTQIKD